MVPIGLLCFWLSLIVRPRPIFGYLVISCGVAWFFSWFCYILGWSLSSALARFSVILWFPMAFYSVPMALLCCWLSLIAGPRPIFGYLWYPVALYSFSHGLVICFGWFFIVGPRPIFGHLMILWRCKVFLLFGLFFCVFLILGLYPILGYLMISNGFVLFPHGFAMLFVDFIRRLSHDLRLSHDFQWFCIDPPWFCYVFGWFHSSAVARSSFILWFPLVSYGVPTGLLCF